jgi:hypothetical protein
MSSGASAAAGAFPLAAYLPRWCVSFIARASLALPRRAPSSLSSRLDLVLTLVLLIALLYMSVGALIRFVQVGIEEEKRVKRRRDSGRAVAFRPIRVASRYYAGASLVISALVFMVDASAHMLASVTGESRYSPAPRLITFWGTLFFFLYVDVALLALSVIRPFNRALAVVFREARSIVVEGPLGAFSESMGDFDTVELLFSRVAMLGATYILASYGK